MNPLLDQLLVGLTLALAAGWFVWRQVRSARRKACDQGCGCASKDPAAGLKRPS